MPIRVKIADQDQWLFPKAAWQELKTPSSDATISVDRNFYVDVKAL